MNVNKLQTLLRAYDQASAPLTSIQKRIAKLKDQIENAILRHRAVARRGPTIWDDLRAALANSELSQGVLGEFELLRAAGEKLLQELQQPLVAFNAAEAALQAEVAIVAPEYARSLVESEAALVTKITDALTPYAESRDEAQRIAQGLYAVRSAQMLVHAFRADRDPAGKARKIISASPTKTA